MTCIIEYLVDYSMTDITLSMHQPKIGNVNPNPSTYYLVCQNYLLYIINDLYDIFGIFLFLAELQAIPYSVVPCTGVNFPYTGVNFPCTGVNSPCTGVNLFLQYKY